MKHCVVCRGIESGYVVTIKCENKIEKKEIDKCLAYFESEAFD